MQRIIFFDGVCNLCDSVVSKVFKIDKNHKFLFASLQSDTARKLLKKQDFEKDSIVYFEEGHSYYYADAVIKILNTLGGIYALTARFISLIPRPIRDFFYRKLAAHRYKIFGEKTECRPPQAAERRYFLD